MLLLKDWAEEHGVAFAKDVALSPNEGGDWGLTSMGYKKAGDVVLTVPKSLMLSSDEIGLDLETNDMLYDAYKILQEANMLQHKPEFLLFCKILMEKSLGDTSLWFPWLESLPQTFTTGVCMDDVERSCLPPLGMALTDYEERKLNAFRKAVMRSTHLFQNLDSNFFSKETTLWAFNVVFTRCWRYSEELQDANVDMVPLGDMFNHREPANVVVQDYTQSDKVDFVVSEDISEGQGLYLSYGLNNPYRFLVIFGFVDEAMPEIFSQVIFTNPSQALIDLGGTDRSKMVYRTEDGAIANAVWDTVLYALLESRPDDQKALHQAHNEQDQEKKADIHATYALEAAYYLRKHVEETLHILRSNPDSEKYCSDTAMRNKNPRLALVCRNNKFLIDVNEKVKKRLDEMVQDETRKRLLQSSQQEQ